MHTEQEDRTNTSKYCVISVEEADSPEGMPPGKWYRYIIGRGVSEIEGLKPGTLHGVTQHAESIADDLNSRANRGGSTYVARQKKNQNT